MSGPSIALIIDDIVEMPPTNGVTNRFVNIAKRLCRHEKTICIIGDRGGTNIPELNAAGLRGYVVPSTWFYSVSGYPKILSLLQEHRINVLHVCNAHQMVVRYGLKFAHALNAHLVVDMHDIGADLVRDSNTRLCFAEQVQQCFVARYADCICVMSNVDLEQLVRYGISRKKLLHSPNGMEGLTASSPTRYRKRVVFVGNLFYPPNMEAAELIASEISRGLRTSGVCFDIIGPCSPDAFARLRRSNVRLLGARADLNTILARAAIGIAPLRSGSGMKAKILDYAACQLPVVCTPIAAQGYPTASGLFVCDGTQAMCNTIDKLLANKRQCLRLGRNLGRTMFAHFNWDSIVTRLESSYSALSETRVIEKPRIDAPAIQQFTFSGVTFPRPFHLLEERYRRARPHMIRFICRL